MKAGAPGSAAARAYGDALANLVRMRDAAAGVTAGSIEERLAQASGAFSDSGVGVDATLPGVDALYRVYSQVPTKKVATGTQLPDGMSLYMSVPVDGSAYKRIGEAGWQAQRQAMNDAGMLYVKKMKIVNGKERAVYMAVGGPEFVRTIKGQKGERVSMQAREALLELAATVFGIPADLRAIRDYYDKNVKSLAKMNRGKVAAATAIATNGGVNAPFASTIRADGKNVAYSKGAAAGYKRAFESSNWKPDANGVCAPDRMTYKSGQTYNYTNLRQGRRKHKSARGGEYESCSFGSMIPDMSKGVSRVASQRFGVAQGSAYNDLFRAAGMGEKELEDTRAAYEALERAAGQYNSAVGAPGRFTRSKLAPYRFMQ